MEIIPGLPEDLAMQCLVRVPYKFHVNLRAVSKSWNALLSCAQFYRERQCHGQCEEGVVSLQKPLQTKSDYDVIIYYPRWQWWERLPAIPREFELEYTANHHSVFVRSNQQLVVMGLLNTCSETECVLIFDFLSRRWRLGADMPFSRCYFSCAASPSEGLVYVGGVYRRQTFPRHVQESFAYNVEENKWDFLPPMNPAGLGFLCAGVFLDGKFYVVSYESSSSQVYDFHTRVWKNINTDSNAHYIHSCVGALRGLEWLTWNDFLRGWINVKEIDTSSNSQSRFGRFAVAKADGDFLLSSVQIWTNRVWYCTFNPEGREKRERRFPNDRLIFSSPSVQI